MEDQKAKKAALRRVEAKIAYRDWKQNKAAEEKLRLRQERIMRKQGMFDSKYGRANSARGGGRGSEMSSHYINTDHKRQQMSTKKAGSIAARVRPKTGKTRQNMGPGQFPGSVGPPRYD